MEHIYSDIGTQFTECTRFLCINLTNIKNEKEDAKEYICTVTFKLNSKAQKYYTLFIETTSNVGKVGKHGQDNGYIWRRQGSETGGI